MAEDSEIRTCSSYFTTFTKYPPAALQFSPTDPDLIFVGTYSLETSNAEAVSEDTEDEKSTAPAKQVKVGELCVYRIVDDKILELEDSIELLAVYDFKFIPSTSNQIIAVHPEGKISLLRWGFDAEKGANKLQLLKTIELVEDASISVLSINVDDAHEMFAVSLSSGEILLCKYDPKALSVEVEHSRQRHSLEAWTVVFSYDGKAFLSGGDDCAFVFSPIDEDGFEEDGYIDTWSNRRIHEAGVTAILPMTETLVLTGSYDEKLRVVNLQTRRAVNELGMGGGVWRLSWIDKQKTLLLASCMHIGTKIVRVSDDGQSLDILCQFIENESMNYASHTFAGRPTRIASSSFYDKRLCLWDSGIPS